MPPAWPTHGLTHLEAARALIVHLVGRFRVDSARRVRESLVLDCDDLLTLAGAGVPALREDGLLPFTHV